MYTVGAAVNWLVVLPLKGLPPGNGWRMPGLVVLPLVYCLLWMLCFKKKLITTKV